MASRVVTGTILDADLTAYPNSPITFELENDFTDLGVTYLHSEVAVLPDATTGYFSVTLAVPTTPATAIYRVRLLDGTEQWIYLTSGPATDLASLLTLAGSPIAQSALQTVIDAHELDLNAHTSLTTLALGANGLVVGTSQLAVTATGVGIGIAAPTCKLDVDSVFAGTSQAVDILAYANPVGAVNVNQYGLNAAIMYHGTGDNAGPMAGIRGVAIVDDNRVDTVTGVDGQAQFSSTDVAAASSLYGMRSVIVNDNVGRIAHGCAFRALTPVNSGGGTIDVAFGAYIGEQGGIATESTAIHIEGSGANNAISFGDGSSDKHAMIYSHALNKLTLSASVGIGFNIDAPLALYDFCGGEISLGSDLGVLTRTNATVKYGALGCPHYLTAEQNACIFQMQTGLFANILNLGGGNGGLNAATYILFHTAGDNVTLIGTERMRIDEAGRVGINDTGPGHILDVNGDVNTTGVYMVDDVQVIQARVVDARVNDAINAAAWDATTAGVLESIRDALVTHGAIAAA